MYIGLGCWCDHCSGSVFGVFELQSRVLKMHDAAVCRCQAEAETGCQDRLVCHGTPCHMVGMLTQGLNGLIFWTCVRPVIFTIVVCTS
jgi:hypothetical protein